MRNKFKVYDSSGITPFGIAISLAAFLVSADQFVSNAYERVKNRPKPPAELPLESDAIDAQRYGKDYRNEDRDHNGARESYFRDPVTRIEYRVRLNPKTNEFTLTKTGM